jgi:hypothetical protein
MARLVPPADVHALSEAIVRLAGDEALMARLGRSARAEYENRYTEDRMLQSYRQLYFDLLSAKCPADASTDAHIHSWRLAEPQEQASQSCSELVPAPRQPKGGVL